MHDPPPGALDGLDLADDPDAGPSPLLRTLVPVVATLVLVALAVGGFALISHLTKDVRTETGSIDLGDARQLALQVPSADVRVVQGDVASPTYEARVTSGLLDTDFALGRRGSVVQVVADCRAWLSPGCGVDLTITVPEGLQVDVVGGSGDVEVAGLTAGVVTIRASEGDVDLDGLGVQDLTVTTGSGDVEATFAEQPFAVKVTTGSGDVDLGLPDGDRPYEVEATSSSGDVEGVDAGAGTDGAPAGDGDVQEGARLVLVRSASGDVEIDRGP